MAVVFYVIKKLWICVSEGLALTVFRAILVPRPSEYPCTYPPYAIEVTVENEYFALETGRPIVCIPTCKEPCIEPPIPVPSCPCPPLNGNHNVPEYCEEYNYGTSYCSEAESLED